MRKIWKRVATRACKTEERNKNRSNPWAFPLKLWERCSHCPLFWEWCRSSSLRLCLIPFAFVCSKCSKDVVKRRCELCVRCGLANGFFFFRIILVLVPLLQLLLALPIELLRSTTSSGVGAGGEKERDPLTPHDEWLRRLAAGAIDVALHNTGNWRQSRRNRSL